MALELAGVVLDKLVSIEATEGARFVRHAVPGLNGEYVQDLGRPGVRIRISGIFYGDTASDDLKALRGHLLDRTPVDFLCELTGQAISLK
jgi:prophage DNA circulation protein